MSSTPINRMGSDGLANTPPTRPFAMKGHIRPSWPTAAYGRLRALGHGLRNRSLAPQHLTRAYEANRKAAIEGIIDADPIAACVREFMSERPSWTGRILGACLRSIVRYIDIAVGCWSICVCDENAFVSSFA